MGGGRGHGEYRPVSCHLVVVGCCVWLCVLCRVGAVLIVEYTTVRLTSIYHVPEN
jgi:hypothetical protein